jgi:hypothetical protein
MAEIPIEFTVLPAIAVYAPGRESACGTIRSDKLSHMMRSFVFLLLAAASVALAHGQQPGQSIEPPQGSQILFAAKGSGAQVYVCSQADAGFKWTFKGPDAKLFDAAGKEIGTHFAGPTWKLADGSQVQGEPIAGRPSTEKDAVAWLLIRAKAGSGTGKMANVAFIQRTETHGGLAPPTGCQSAADLGKAARSNYSATYSFYAAASQ